MMETKNIRIPHHGPIFPKGGTIGPIKNPYRETISVIGQLVLQNYKVVEVLADGSEVELTIHNFDKKNDDKAVEAPVKPEEKDDVIIPVQTGDKQKQEGLSKKERRRQEQQQQQKKELAPDDMEEK